MFLRQYVCHCIIFCIQNIQKAPSFPPCVDASKPSSRFWNANVWAGCTKKRARLWWRQPSPPKGMVTRPRAARHKTGLRTGANAPAFCAIVLKGTTDWASHSVWARPHCHCSSITVKCKPLFFSEGSVIVNNRCKHPIYTYILPNKSKQLLQLLLS